MSTYINTPYKISTKMTSQITLSALVQFFTGCEARWQNYLMFGSNRCFFSPSILVFSMDNACRTISEEPGQWHSNLAESECWCIYSSLNFCKGSRLPIYVQLLLQLSCSDEEENVGAKMHKPCRHT